jgi:FAD/FMN-containing dehydrogenase/membrane-associated phospholipid phosphatase
LIPHRSENWHPATLVSGCVLSIVYLASWFLEPTRALWLALDERVFWALNNSLAWGTGWQVVWAAANNRAVDVVAAVCMIGLFAHFVLRKAGDRTNFFVAIGVLLTGLIYAGSRISVAIDVGRLSPTLVHPDAHRISELVSWIPTKDSAYNCFPGHHALVLFICAGVITYYLPRAYAIAAWALTVVFTAPRLVGGAHWLTDDLVGSVAVAGFVLCIAFATPLHSGVTGALERLVGRGRSRWVNRRTRTMDSGSAPRSSRNAGIMHRALEPSGGTTMPSSGETLPSFMQWKEISSLVGSMRSHSLVAYPMSIEECREALQYCRSHDMTVCARDAGRNYGDLALNDGQCVLDTSLMNKVLSFDEENHQITVEAGTRLIDIYKEVHYRLLTLPASPTESHSSVAGAICANVNGKDAWRRGSFAHQIVRMKLMLADGEILDIDRSHELFNAVVGGIGLLGVIVEATLQLQPIPSPFVEINRIPAADIDELLEKMAAVEQSYDAAVVWVDAYAGGRRTGRSVIHAAKWIERDDSEAERKEYLDAGYKRLDNHRRLGLALHQKLGPFLSLTLHVQRPLVSLFNRLYYAASCLTYKTGRSSNTELFLRFSFEASFTVPPAHLVCGPRGYTVQLTFPRASAREAIIELLDICRTSPSPPVTTIMRAHKKDEAMLSFSEDGYSLNFEFHPKKRNEAASREAVDRLIEATIKRGGKIHLAKDQVLRPEQFYRVFPRYEELLEVKKRLDPEGLFTSDLARRVGIAQVLQEGDS